MNITNIKKAFLVLGSMDLEMLDYGETPQGVPVPMSTGVMMTLSVDDKIRFRVPDSENQVDGDVYPNSTHKDDIEYIGEYTMMENGMPMVYYCTISEPWVEVVDNQYTQTMGDDSIDENPMNSPIYN